MTLGNRSLLIATIAALTLAAFTLVGCGGHTCTSPITGTTGGGGTAGVATSSVCAGVSGVGSGSGGGGIGGGGIGGGSAAALVYYPFGTTLQGAGLSASGTFANLSPFTPPTLAGVAIDDMTIVNKQFLYIPFSDISAVQAFTINRSTGALTTIAGSPFAASGGADVAVTDPKARFLFVGGESTGNVTVFQIDAKTGVLTPSPGNPFTAPLLLSADSLTVDSTGHFLYVGEQNPSGFVHAFSIDQNTGVLSQLAGSPFTLGASILQADPVGNFLFGVSDEFASNGDKSIHVFAIDATSGSLSPVSGQPFPTTNAGFSLAVHPSGKFLYALTKPTAGSVTNSAMEGFQINTASGALSPLPGSPFTSLPTAELCRFDQSGSEMICDDTALGRLMVFTTNPTTGAVSHTVTDLGISFSFTFAVTD